MQKSNAIEEIGDLILLGIQHEQQHQELMVTDALHLFSCHPFLPVLGESSGGNCTLLLGTRQQPA
jgi:hypothetical protein